jgi:hypothetical protein
MGLAHITEWDRARNTPKSGGVDLEVDFDPNTLSLTYVPTGTTGGTTSTTSGSVSKTPAQQTAQTSTLSLDLTFDTAAAGTTVQARTDPLVRLTKPPNPAGESPERPVVRFHWGAFLYYGVISSLSQTINFFSDAGIPLRAEVHLSLAEVDPPFPGGGGDAGPGGGSAGAGASAGLGFGASASFGASAGIGASAGFSAGFSAGASAGIGAGASFGVGAGASVGTTPLTLSGSGDTIQSITARAGGNASWKTVAAANGIDNPRLLAPGTVLDARARLDVS